MDKIFQQGVDIISWVGLKSPYYAGEILRETLKKFDLAESESVNVANLLTSATILSAASMQDLRTSLAAIEKSSIPLLDFVCLVECLCNVGIKGAYLVESIGEILAAKQKTHPNKTLFEFMEEMAKNWAGAINFIGLQNTRMISAVYKQYDANFKYLKDSKRGLKTAKKTNG